MSTRGITWLTIGVLLVVLWAGAAIAARNLGADLGQGIAVVLP